MRLYTASAVSLVVMLIAAPAAIGLEPGVHVDPHSPSGTEYSFPLGSTRQQLGGGSAAGVSSGSGPLFGIGLGRTTGDRGTADGTARGTGRGHVGARRGAGSRSRRAAGKLRREQGEAIAALGQSSSGRGPIAVVAAVLALGAAGGLGLWLIARRRRAGEQ